MQIAISFNNKTLKKMKNSSKNQVVNSVFFTLDSKIQEMVNKIVAAENRKLAEKNRSLLSFYDIESISLSLEYDLIKAIEKYTDCSDELKSINYSYLGSGTIEISATIIRNGAEYQFHTSLIEAGGYNVQCLHYRYITKTNLPKTGNSVLTEKYKGKLKRVAKIKNLKEQIAICEVQIKQYQSIICEYSAKTDEELKASAYYFGLTWQDMIERGADENFKGGESEFNKIRESNMNSEVEKNRNHIQWMLRYKMDAFKRIQKFQDQICAIELGK